MRIGVLFSLATVTVASAALIAGQPVKKPPADGVQPGRYAPLPIGRVGPNAEDLCMVLDTTTGRVWAYTSRGAFGPRWVDLGVPAEAKEREK